MDSSSPEKYIPRLAELKALHRELETGARPGDGAVVVGLLLEAAGDVLRRKTHLGVPPSEVMSSLESVPQLALRSWGEGVEVAELATKLQRAASQAVEAAIPDSPEDGEVIRRWAVQDLQARDRLESALVALEAMGSGRPDATTLAARLRRAANRVDRACRTIVVSLTALNEMRRAEAELLDPEFRSRAWWYSDRTGIEDDLLVKILGGEAQGSLPAELEDAHAAVHAKRSRRVGFDDLLRLDLGVASPAEKEMIWLRSVVDAELKLSLAAMGAAEASIEEEVMNEVTAPSSVAAPAEGSPRPEIVEERAEFKVLLFRSKKSVQVIIQPHQLNRLAAAAVYRSDQPERPFPSAPGDMGLHFELGAAERLVGAAARVVVKLVDGQTHTLEIRL